MLDDEMLKEKIKEKLRERLKELRKKSGLTGRKVAEGIDVDYKVYQAYESGARNAGLPVVVKLANFYGVSTDYILGMDGVSDQNEEQIAVFDALLDELRKAPPEMKAYFGARIKEAFLSQYAPEIMEEERSKTISVSESDDIVVARTDNNVVTEKSKPTFLDFLQSDEITDI